MNATKDRVVRIECGSHVGTGFVFADGRVLTALHVIADRERQPIAAYEDITLVFHREHEGTWIPKPVPGILGSWSVDDDWVVVEFVADKLDRLAPQLELSPEGSVLENAKWSTYGFPVSVNEVDGGAAGGHVQTLRGSYKNRVVIELFSEQAAAGDGEPIQGYSGAPVLVDGRVVGILRAGPRNQERAAYELARSERGTLYATPIWRLVAPHGPLLTGQPARPASAPMKRIRGYSLGAKHDAGVVIAEHHDRLGEVSLSQVYVERRIEKDILARLRGDSAPAPILVIGEPGSGKTSLLWHLHEVLLQDDGREPWLLKATSVMRFDSGFVEDALDDALSAGIRPVVLLDTVDLLLHSEHELDTLRVLVHAVAERGSGLVMACRPREAQILAREIRSGLVLGDYDDPELASAIEKYVKRFYVRAEVRAIEEHRARFANLVATRHPLREITVHPLTMRMFFELYAPFEVPPEIDVAGLYDAFWRDRVESDRRAGTRIAAEDTPDLRNAAGAIAVEGMVRGTIALSLRHAKEAVRKVGAPLAHVEHLLRRGILNVSETRIKGETWVEFFHQTFFEHAAARGLLAALREAGLELLRARVDARPDDLLAVAVLEQALLVGGAEDEFVAAAATAVFQRLLQSRHPTLSGAAVAVYARVKEATPETIAEAARAMTAPLAADRFISMIASVPVSRQAETFAHLAAIWARAFDARHEPGQWANCEHMLDELPRLAMREDDAPSVRAFLREFRIIDALARLKPDSTAGSKLLIVLAALAPHDPEHVWADFIALARGVHGPVPTTDFTALVLRTIARQAAVLRRQNLAQAFEAEAALQPERYDTDVNRALGLLWFMQWQESTAPLEAALCDIAAARECHRRRPLLSGLCYLLRTRGRADVLIAWAAFAKEEGIPRRSEWIRIVWQELLETCEQDAAPEVRDEIGSRIAAMLAAAPEKGKDAERRQFARATRKVWLPDCIAQPLFDDPRTSQVERWLSRDDLGDLVAFAFIRRQPAAVEAVRRMAMSLEGCDPKVASLAATALAPQIAASPDDLGVFLRLTSSIRDSASLFQALKTTTVALEEELPRHAEMLSAFADDLMSSRSHIERRSGARLRIELIHRGLAPRPSGKAVEALIERLQREGDGVTRGWLATLLGETHGDAADQVLPVLLSALLDAAKQRAATGHPTPSPRASVTDAYSEKVFAAAIHLARASVVRWALEIFDQLQYLLVNAGVVRQIGWLISDLCKVDIQIATSLVEKLLTSTQVAALGPNGLSALRATLRKPMREWMAAAPAADRARVLARSRELHLDLARLVIEAACRERFADVEEQLRGMMHDPEMPDGVRVYVGIQIDVRRDTPRDGDWPELRAAWNGVRRKSGE